MKKSCTARIALAVLLTLSGSLSLTGAAGGQGSAEPAPARAGGSSCDEMGWDWGADKIAPGNKNFNPEFKGTETQLWQHHYRLENTSAFAIAGRKGVQIYIEDVRSGQQCFSKKADYAGQLIATGVLDNRNTSIRVVIEDPDSGKYRGNKAYREDAGGHRQNGNGTGRIDGDIDKDAEANYDHNESWGISTTLPAKYNADYGHITRGTLEQNIFDEGAAHETFGFVTTNNKEMMVSLQSDKYGQGEWRKVHRVEHSPRPYEGRTGILYNRSDALRVCLKQVGEDVAHCGKWHRGPGDE